MRRDWEAAAQMCLNAIFRGRGVKTSERLTSAENNKITTRIMLLCALAYSLSWSQSALAPLPL